MRTPYSLTEARVIFEPAQREAHRNGRVAPGAGPGPGCLGRILARFDTDGLIPGNARRPTPRRQVVRLTPAGRKVHAMLGGRSDQDVVVLLALLPDERCSRLIAAMRTVQARPGDPVERLEVVLRPLRPGGLGWLVECNAVLYHREYGWEHTYKALVARIVAGFAADHDPGREAAWIAGLEGEPVGCVFCVRRDETTGQRLLVGPSARGMSIRGRLVDGGPAVRRRGGLPGDRAVGQRPPHRGPADLPAGRFHAGVRGAAPRLRPGPGRPVLAPRAVSGGPGCGAGAARRRAPKMRGPAETEVSAGRGSQRSK